MRRIDGYVMRTVGGAMFLVMMVVLSLDVIFAFIAELDDTRNDYQTLQALWYVFLTLPRRIYDYLPLGAFMGCLESTQRQIIVYSPWQSQKDIPECLQGLVIVAGL